MKTILRVGLFVAFLLLASANRQKRYLIVPPSVPERHQWIAGIGIPLDLENLAVTTGYVLRAQYFLPASVDDLFPLKSWENLERQRRDLPVELVDNSTGIKYTKYDVPAVVVEEGENERKPSEDEEDEELANWDNDADIKADSETAKSFWNGLYDSSGGTENSRWLAYKALEGVAQKNRMGGKDCVLRSICESAATPLSHKSGIFGELLHILLTPSSSGDQATTEEHREYQEAEKVGKEDPESCEEKFPDCTRSLMDVVTTFDDPFESLFRTFG